MGSDFVFCPMVLVLVFHFLKKKKNKKNTKLPCICHWNLFHKWESSTVYHQSGKTSPARILRDVNSPPKNLGAGSPEKSTILQLKIDENQELAKLNMPLHINHFSLGSQTTRQTNINWKKILLVLSILMRKFFPLKSEKTLHKTDQNITFNNILEVEHYKLLKEDDL